MLCQVAPQQFKKWLEQFTHEASKPIVLDVREPWECAQASIQPSADEWELVCIPMGEVPARLHELDSQRPVACLCHHGVRSMRAAAYLVGQGFEQVANITGGIDAWSHTYDATVPRY